MERSRPPEMVTRSCCCPSCLSSVSDLIYRQEMLQEPDIRLVQHVLNCMHRRERIAYEDELNAIGAARSHGTARYVTVRYVSVTWGLS